MSIRISKTCQCVVTVGGVNLTVWSESTEKKFANKSFFEFNEFFSMAKLSPHNDQQITSATRRSHTVLSDVL